MSLKLGISSYCLSRKIYAGDMTLFDVMDWAKEHDCDHMEVVPFGLPMTLEDGSPNHDFAKRVGEYADKIGLPLSAFSLNACVIRPGDENETKEEKYQKEIERIEMIMDLAYEMGIRKMRHDTCTGQHPLGVEYHTPEQFEEDFPTIVRAVKEVADYAASKGMRTTLENHGRYVNGADRLIRIIKAAGKDNVGMTMDVGNFLCVNEDPVTAVQKTIGYANMIHLKDFYIRKTDRMYPQKRVRPTTPEEWHTMLPSLAYVGTNAADYQLLRGAIIGQGDMDMWKIISIIKNSGYDQEISLEFEGMEDCIAGTTYGLETARYIWERV